jgi:hypothetical protein
MVIKAHQVVGLCLHHGVVERPFVITVTDIQNLKSCYRTVLYYHR